MCGSDSQAVTAPISLNLRVKGRSSRSARVEACNLCFVLRTPRYKIAMSCCAPHINENGRVGRCTAIHEQKQCDARGHICPIACGRCKPCPGHPRYSSSDTELRAAMVDRDRRFACAPSGFLCSSANSSSSRDRRAAAKRLREPLDTEVVVSVL